MPSRTPQASRATSPTPGAARGQTTRRAARHLAVNSHGRPMAAARFSPCPRAAPALDAPRAPLYRLQGEQALPSRRDQGSPPLTSRLVYATRAPKSSPSPCPLVHAPMHPCPPPGACWSSTIHLSRASTCCTLGGPSSDANPARLQKAPMPSHHMPCHHPTPAPRRQSYTYHLALPTLSSLLFIVAAEIGPHRRSLLLLPLLLFLLLLLLLAHSLPPLPARRLRSRCPSISAYPRDIIALHP